MNATVSAEQEMLASLKAMREVMHECRRYIVLDTDNGFAAYRASADACAAADAAIARAEGRDFVADGGS